MALGLVMAGGGTLQWLGQQVVSAVQSQIDQQLNRTGQRWLAIATAIAPVRSGELRAGLFARVENRTLTVGGTVPHTIFADRGTRNMAGQWFIERALNEVGFILGGAEIEFTIPHIVSPVLSHKGTFIIPSAIQPRPLTARQKRRIAANAVMAKRHYRGNVKLAKFRARRMGP